jgi:RNA-directed DNA polymerase
MDVRKFFPSVRHYVLRDTLRREYGFGRDVAWILTRLVTVDSELPQGTPTSPIVANLLLTNALDRPVTAAAIALGAENTRFLDDVTFSGDEPRALVNIAARGLSRKRLAIWRRKGEKPKFKITPNSARQEVTGLTVNSKAGPSVPKRYRDNVRAAVHELPTLPRHELVGKRDSIAGKIAYVRRTNPGAADRLQKYLDAHTAAAC